MTDDLQGRVALVTGGARGQGAAEATLFSAKGAHVIVADIREDEGTALARSIPNASFMALDVASEASWKNCIAAIEADHGRLDILVNNAAIAYFNSIEKTPLADFERVMSVNLNSVFLGMQAAIRLMKGTGGSVINITSIAALRGRRELGAYGAAKWALRGLTKTAALEFAPYRVRVNSVCPGLIDTPMNREVYGLEKIQTRGAAIPVGRAGVPEDIANLVLFLASDASGYCNGAEFLIDGGETAGM